MKERRMIRISDSAIGVILVAWSCLAVGDVGVNADAAEPVVSRNIEYVKNGSRSRSLDVYHLSQAKDSPVVIWVHGGAWKIGDKRGVNEKPRAFTEAGFVLVSINYRLHPDADVEGQATDVAAAVKWTRENIAEFGGNADQLFLMGHSAGAHLVAYVATDHRFLTHQKLKSRDVAGVILLDGAAYDVPMQIRQSRPFARGMYTSVFSEDIAKQTEASPVHHAKTAKNVPPFLILHCADRDASTQQSELLGRTLRDQGGVARVVAAEGKTHTTINRELGLSGDKPTNEVFGFLKECLQKSRAHKAVRPGE